MVKDYVARKRAEKNLPPESLTSDEMPADEDNVADDEEIRQKIQMLIEKDAPDLVPIEGYIAFDQRKSRILPWLYFYVYNIKFILNFPTIDELYIPSQFPTKVILG